MRKRRRPTGRGCCSAPSGRQRNLAVSAHGDDVGLVQPDDGVALDGVHLRVLPTARAHVAAAHHRRAAVCIHAVAGDAFAARAVVAHTERLHARVERIRAAQRLGRALRVAVELLRSRLLRRCRLRGAGQ